MTTRFMLSGGSRCRPGRTGSRDGGALLADRGAPARGIALREGDLMITGGPTAAVPLAPVDVVHAEFEHPSMNGRRVAMRR